MHRDRPSVDLSRRVFLGGSLLGVAASSASSRADSGESAGDDLPVSCTVNGSPYEVSVDGEARAVDLLRRDLQLTGTKEACTSGACGACTVLLNGVPHVTCVLPALALHGREVVTVEGMGGPTFESLHPVQRAFLAEDAVLCGFCTPGFVVEAVAFVERYRAAGRTEEPSRDEVSQAFSGHLCRCGAYEAIHRAVVAACRGGHDSPSGVVPVRPDALAKVTGQARYAVDVQAEGVLEGVVMRAPYAHARLERFDATAALNIPGVQTVYRLVPDGGRVKYAGQAVAVVVATDRKTAARAARRIDADWEVLPAATSLEGALEVGAPLVFPSRTESAEAPVAGTRLPATWDRNLRGPVTTVLSTHSRAADRGMSAARESGIVAEATYRTGAQAACALEPHAVLARWSDDDRLEVWASTDGVQELATQISTEYRLGAGRCTVLGTYVGGGFGSKSGLTPEIRAAIELARQLRLPVRIVLDRREELQVGGARAPTQTEIALAASAEADLLGLIATTYSSAGAAVGNLSAQAARFLYPHEAKQLRDYDVVSHTPPAVPLRAPGGAALFFALESTVDQVAAKLNVDPLALRKRWDPDPVRQSLYEWASTLPAAQERAAADFGRFRRGIGIAAAAWAPEWVAAAMVEIAFGPDGCVVRSGCQDTGDGTAALLAAAVAERLGIRAADVQVELGSSAFVYGPSATEGRPISLLAAVHRATDRLLADLIDLAEDRHVRGEPSAGGIRTAQGLVPWRQIVEGAAPVRAIGRRGRKLREIGLPRPFASDPPVASAVTVVRVQIDTRLGRVHVVEGWVAVGAGRIVAPAVARAQVIDAFIQNVGYALFEDRRLDPLTGRVLSHDLADYLIPGFADAPRLSVSFEEAGFEDLRGGSLDVSEVGGIGAPAAIANAITAATGRRPFRLPLTPTRVLELLA